MITLYGIRNCDTCRAALKWLEAQGIAHRFHDLRADGLEPRVVAGWVEKLGWETVLNRRSTTWRELSEKERGTLDARSATALMMKHPTLIKRPVIDSGKSVLVGFNEKNKAALRED